MTLPGPIRIFAARPRLVGAAAVGLAVWIALTLASDLRASTRGILAWDLGCLSFIVGAVIGMAGQQSKDIQRRSKAQDEGRGFILALVLAAAIASVGAIALELSLAKTAHGLEKTVRIGLAFATVAISWFLVQLIFALHYAHEYYEPSGKKDPIQRGLGFPQDDAPDYWDFLHFSVVIGVASQTADIAFTSKELRRIGTVHGVIAFLFNTVVLALTINLVAGLFG